MSEGAKYNMSSYSSMVIVFSKIYLVKCNSWLDPHKSKGIILALNVV